MGFVLVPSQPPIPPYMRAWIAQSYGGPDVLDLQTVATPRPKPGEILVRVEATTVSSGDRRIRALDLPAGMGLLGRLVLGLTKPRQPILGAELTGIVAAIGEGVTQFQPGEAIIAFPGGRQGAHAEYCVLGKKSLVIRRPPQLDHATAAALCFGGSTALHFLRKAGVRAAHHILIIGASGAVGSAMVQIARHQGATVTAVTSTANIDLVRALGANTIIDYTAQDFMGGRENCGREQYDCIADTVAATNFARCLPILKPNGCYLAIAGGITEMLARKVGNKRCIAGPAEERDEDLQTLLHLVEIGAFKPLIDQVFSFEDMPNAHGRADSGRKRGSVVVMVGQG